MTTDFPCNHLAIVQVPFKFQHLCLACYSNTSCFFYPHTQPQERWDLLPYLWDPVAGWAGVHLDGCLHQGHILGEYGATGQRQENWLVPMLVEHVPASDLLLALLHSAS
jgi:hypothetical protein